MIEWFARFSDNSLACENTSEMIAPLLKSKGLGEG
jgi:hypothetical protein